MKKSFSRFFPYCLLICLFFACSKQHFIDEPPGSQYPPVFDSYTEAGTAVSHYLQQAGQGEEFLQVDKILFLESGQQSYALVYYTSSNGHSNILYEKTYERGLVATGKVYKCSSNNCECLVLVEIRSNGTVTYDCSCANCTMTISPFE